jgi:DNA-binding protein Fis
MDHQVMGHLKRPLGQMLMKLEMKNQTRSAEMMKLMK